MIHNSFQYSIFDPTGNITALVEGDVCIEDQPAAAAEIMKTHPEVEQVGFIRIPDGSEDGYDVDLRMTGGEFCGNASMCAAVFYVMRNSERNENHIKTVKLRVSGTSEPVIVDIGPACHNSFNASITMPDAVDISTNLFAFEKLSENLPVVKYEGIVHIIITPASPFYYFLNNRKDAEFAVKKWCEELKSDGLGLMFLDQKADAYQLTPLVYIPGSGTLFWENSCASGSAAVGLYLAKNNGCHLKGILHEPGGNLTVESDPVSQKTILSSLIKI